MKSPQTNEAQREEHCSFRNLSPEKSNQHAHMKRAARHLDVFAWASYRLRSFYHERKL